MNNDHRPIVFVDGHCLLCSGFSVWLMTHDKKAQFRIGALQGKTAHKLIFETNQAPYTTKITQTDLKQPSTILLYENGRIYDRSTAVLRILSRLAAPWHFLSYLLWVPKFLRDSIYNWVANNRYQWFGRHDVCQVPTASDKTRIAD